MADRPITIIRIRRGINGYPYAACDDAGYFIGNFSRLGDARKHWQQEIKWGQVKLIRELDKRPDMAKHNAALQAIDKILRKKMSPPVAAGKAQVNKNISRS